MSVDPRLETQTQPSLSAAGRASLAVAEMRQTLLRQLWQTALGSAEGEGMDGGVSLSAPGFDQSLAGFNLEALLAMQGEARETPPPPAGAAVGNGDDGGLSLGPNAIYADDINAAARRTGLSPAMLAAIIGAEAASRDGVWDPASRNPRSSAAGLTQFLSSTWITEAQRSGTYLNGVASRSGWLDADGRVRAQAEGALLSLRFDPRASIEAAADYADANLDQLRRQGHVGANASPETLAKVAYLAHHLGAGDAARFLDGRISPERARTLLNSQIGQSAASARIEAAGGASAVAHRQWLTAYVDRKIDLDRYQRTDAVA